MGGHPSDYSENPSIKKMLGPVADAEVDLLIESANYFMFIEAKKPARRPGSSETRKNTGRFISWSASLYKAVYWPVRSTRHSCWPRWVASDGDSVQAELREGDRRLLKVVEQSEQDFPFPDMPNVSWNLLPE